MDIEEFNKKDILRDFEYELNKLCRSCIGTATEIQIKQRPLISLFHQLVWFYEKEKEKNKNIDEFCRKELAFERRLKRENREPDEFNQGRFYVSENIRKIIEEE